ncbi:MAG TPA: SDR family NAD(P)-dependent oxidoreductase [Pseudonocardia sp.]
MTDAVNNLAVHHSAVHHSAVNNSAVNNSAVNTSPVNTSPVNNSAVNNIAFDFCGRTTLITGAAQGIGLELARLFSAAGARVAVADRDGDRLRAEWGERSDTVLPLPLDVADDAQVARAVAEGPRLVWRGGCRGQQCRDYP